MIASIPLMVWQKTARTATRLAPRASGRAGKGAGAGKGASHANGGRPARSRERLPRDGGRTREALGDAQERQVEIEEQGGDVQAQVALGDDNEATKGGLSKDDKVILQEVLRTSKYKHVDSAPLACSPADARAALNTHNQPDCMTDLSLSGVDD